MQKIVLILFLVGNNSFASSWIADLPETIENTIQRHLKYHKADKCIEDHKKVNEYNQCLVDVCGQPPAFTTLLDQYLFDIEKSSEPSKNLSEKEAKLQSKIKYYFKNFYNNNPKSIENEKAVIEEVRKQAKNGISSTSTQFPVMYAMMDTHEMLTNNIVADGDGGYSIKQEYLDKLSTEKASRIKDFFSKILPLFVDPTREMKLAWLHI